jgi:hypothetical protein
MQARYENSVENALVRRQVRWRLLDSGEFRHPLFDRSSLEIFMDDQKTRIAGQNDVLPN